MSGERALVVFSGRADLPILRMLRPGFRHCFLLVEGPGHWLIYEPLSHRTEIGCIVDMEAEGLADFYRRQGMKVVETRRETPPRRLAPIRPFTCVEAVKRVLGLHAPWVLTPAQLHKFLLSRKIVIDFEVELGL